MPEFKTPQSQKRQNTPASVPHLDSALIPGALAMTNGQILKRLRQVWESMKAPNDFFNLSSFERDRIVATFLIQSSKEGIPDRSAFFFLDFLRNKHDLQQSINMSGGQAPDVVFFSNTTSSHISDIFGNGTARIEDGVQFGGAFGGAAKIGNAVDARRCSDYTAAMYMMNHFLELSKENHSGEKPSFSISRDVAPYIIFFGDFDSKKGLSFENVAKVQLERLSVLAEKAKHMGHRIPPLGETGLSMWNFYENRFLLLPLVHDIETRKIYVVWEKEGQIEKIPFSDFISFQSLSNHPVVAKHLENIKKHESNPFITEITRRRSCCTTVCCVDARCGNNQNGGLAKTIGSYPRGNELKRMMRDSELEAIRIHLHTDCGYIKTAIKFSYVFDELGKALEMPEKEAYARKVLGHLEDLMKGSMDFVYTKRHFRQISKLIGFSSSVKNTASVLLCGISQEPGINILDYQRSLKHMYDRGIITGDSQSGFKVASVSTVREFLASNNVAVNPKQFAYLVTEELGRTLISAIMGLKAKLSIDKPFKVYIESLSNAGVFKVAEALTVENATDFNRPMFSGEIGDEKLEVIEKEAI